MPIATSSRRAAALLAKPLTRRIDHDQLCKQLLECHFMDFLKLFFHDLARRVVDASVEFLPTQMFTVLSHGKRRGVDLLARVRLRGEPGGPGQDQEEDTALLIHIEAQAKNDANLPFRMFKYCAILVCKYDGLPVYPIGLLSFDRPYKEVDAVYVMRSAALMAKMNVAAEDRVEVTMACLRMLATLRMDPERAGFLAGFVETYIKLNEAQERELQAKIQAAEAIDKEPIMQLVTSWTKRGRAEGRTEGEARFACRMLARRLGDLDASLVHRIERLTLPQLDDLGQSLLDFATQADLRAWLDARAA